MTSTQQMPQDKMGHRPAPILLADLLHSELRQQAAETTIATLTIGLGYTAVETTQGDVGLSYTMTDRSAHCTRVRTFRDYREQPAIELLDHLRSDSSLERSIGLATANALNRGVASSFPTDKAQGDFLRLFDVREGTRVAMVGFFGPVIAQLEKLKVELSILDRGRKLGDEQQFMSALESWPEVLVLTATSILNASFEQILNRVTRDAKVVVLGPSTPMMPSAFRPFPVDMLAGTVAIDTGQVIAVVRQGGGTPQLLPFSRKISCELQRD